MPFELDEDGRPTTPIYVYEGTNEEDVNGSFNAATLILKKLNPYVAKKIDGEFVSFIFTATPVQPTN